MSARQIEIVPYRDSWPVAFQRIRDPIQTALGSLAIRIDHIGSTSVPGLAAKDIIDVQVSVSELDPEPLVVCLEPLGYTLRTDIVGDHVPAGENPDPSEWTKVYFRPPLELRPMHLHIRQMGRANQRYALLFRDYLRANDGAAESYAIIKRALARLHPDDIDAYYAIKDPACDLIMDAACRWQRETGWVVESSMS